MSLLYFWKLLTGKDDYIALVICNARKTPEEQIRHFSGFCKNEVAPCITWKNTVWRDIELMDVA